MSPTIKLLKRKKPDKTINSIALAKLYNSTRWRKLRAYKLQENPLCQICESEGRVTPAREVHHKIPVDPNDIDPAICFDYDLLMSLCVSCHRKIQT